VQFVGKFVGTFSKNIIIKWLSLNLDFLARSKKKVSPLEICDVTYKKKLKINF